MAFMRQWGCVLWLCTAACSPAVEQPARQAAPPARQRAAADSPAPWTAHMVRDINSLEWSYIGGEREYFDADRMLPPNNHLLFFTSWDPLSGRELWVSDGTPQGTRLLKDIVPGTADSNPQDFVPAGNLMFFTAADTPDSPSEDGNRELWRTDGTPEGTVKVKELYPGPVGADLWLFKGSAGGKLIFQARDPEHGRELWVSDGTEAGTERLTEVLPGTAGFNISGSFPTELNGVLYGRLGVTGIGFEPWRTDGTPAGTYRLKDICPGACSSYGRPLVTGNGQVFLLANDGTHGMELWKTDGTEAGTVMVKDVFPGGESSGSPPSGPNWSTMRWFNGALYFSAFTAEQGVELWKSDGTEEGTALVTDLWPGTAGAEPFWLRELNGRLYFVATTGYELREDEVEYLDRELWTTDGTAAGTRRVKDIWPGVGGSFPESLVVSGDLLYFPARDSYESGVELWKSDGTEEGTSRVQDLAPLQYSGSAPIPLVDLGGRLAFYADLDGNPGTWAGTHLLTTDGTQAGTVPVRDMMPRQSPSYPKELTDVDGTLYFWAYQGNNDVREPLRLWKSDGTREGTVQVSPVLRPYYPYTDGYLLASTFITAFQGRVFTLGMSGDDLEESGLWVSDGTASGTVNISRARVSGRPVELGGALYFTGDDASGFGLWKTDGTVEGTTLLQDVGTRAVGAPGRVGGTLYFAVGGGNVETAVLELWKSDGTQDGTSLVEVLSAARDVMLPESFAELQGQTYFVVPNSTGAALWKTDGTAAGTVVVKASLATTSQVAWRLVPLGGRILFVADGALWATDGTDAGTVRLTGAGVSGVDHPVVAGALAYFLATDAASGAELWKTDGTPAGTSRVKDVIAGPQSSLPGHLLPLSDGRLLFTARDASSGHEPWISDGTEAGTYQLMDLAPGPLGSMPEWFRESNGRVFFSAAVDLRGRELWSMGPGADTVPPTVSCPADVTAEAVDASGAPAHFAQATATDDRSEVTVSSSHASGAVFPVGTTDVVFTARDSAGNTSTCTLHVTVRPLAVQDAGTAEPDAGTSAPDSGTAEPDAGTSAPDAGTSVPDAGTAAPDAGTGGSEEPPPSDDGASCGSCSAGATGPVLAWGALLLAGALSRRRRHGH